MTFVTHCTSLQREELGIYRLLCSTLANKFSGARKNERDLT